MKFAVGKRIRTLRTEKGINLPELAEKAGVSKGFLSQLENDEEANPSLDSLNKLAKALEVTLAQLLERDQVRAHRIVPDQIEPGLKEFMDECHRANERLDESIVQALYVLQQRKGQAMKGKDDWRWLYESIKRGVKPT